MWVCVGHMLARVVLSTMIFYYILDMYWVYVREMKYWVCVGHMIDKMMIDDDF